jgi:hypothetical protein
MVFWLWIMFLLSHTGAFTHSQRFSYINGDCIKVPSPTSNGYEWKSEFHNPFNTEKGVLAVDHVPAESYRCTHTQSEIFLHQQGLYQSSVTHK